MKKIIFRLTLALIVLGAAWSAYRFFQQLPQRQQQIATARVRQGDVVIRSFARGELRAVRSAMLIAPNLFGTVQITKMAPLGSFAREKDLIVEFDESEVRSRLEERELDLQQIDEQIKKAQADLQIRNNQDQVSLLQARYAVRRAELEVKRAELKSAIDAKRDLLNLEEARRRLKQLESDIKSRQDQAQAELAVLRERRNRSLLEFQRERQRLMQIKLLAPMSGLVAIRQSRAIGGYFPGMQLPDYREGDQVYPGLPIADVLDLSEMELAAKVGELDRANLHEGQEALFRLDAVPDKVFHGKIKSMSGTASANVWSGDPAKKFDVVFSVDMQELLTGLGAKPEQIKMILETAQRNRSKPLAATMSASRFAGGFPGGEPARSAGGPGGPPGGFATMLTTPPGMSSGGVGRGESRGATPGVAFAQESGADPGAQGGERRRAMRFGGPQMSEEDQKKMRALFEKELGGRQMQDLSPEERRKVFEKIREAMGGALRAGGSGQRSGQRAERGGRESGESAGAESEATARGARRGRREEMGSGGPGEPAGILASMGLPAGFGMGAAQQFSEKDLENAKLPPPPEEDSQLDVLLRPGLLADVEIIVEKIPNAIYVPIQAVFEKDGKPAVYVKSGNAFETRFIKPLKRSESVMVIAEGVKPGEIVALSDPTVRPGERKKEEEKKGGAKAGGIPVGAGAGGR